jgi:hypothetical protein
MVEISLVTLILLNGGLFLAGMLTTIMLLASAVGKRSEF